MEYRGKSEGYIIENADMILTKIQQSALAGMILGDGYLQSTGERNARLRLEHKADHKDYLIWKTKLLPQLFQGNPVFLKRLHPISKKTYSYVRQQSNSSPVLGGLKRIFYPHGKKIIPNNLEKFLLNDISLAIWYFDDGYYSRRDNSVYIYLGRVSRKEAEIASKVIENRFGIKNAILDKKEKGFVIYISPGKLKDFFGKIREYAIPIMNYKIPS